MIPNGIYNGSEFIGMIAQGRERKLKEVLVGVKVITEYGVEGKITNVALYRNFISVFVRGEFAIGWVNINTLIHLEVTDELTSKIQDILNGTS